MFFASSLRPTSLSYFYSFNPASFRLTVPSVGDYHPCTTSFLKWTLCSSIENALWYPPKPQSILKIECIQISIINCKINHCSFFSVLCIISIYLRILLFQFAQMKTSKEHLEGKPSSERLNKTKVKVRDALT
jgi:hypothetical protein